MREYKFRAWDEELGEMLYSETKLFDDLLGFRFKHFEADEPIFMQYTGIKDMNGKEIYEGDIVDHKESDRRYSVGYWEALGSWVGYRLPKSLNMFSRLSAVLAEQLEIIGNICENPELLEEED